MIIGQGGAIRATAGLVGRGACLVNGRKVIAASYDAHDGGWETNPTCYTMPDALKSFNGKPVWEAAGGTWMGHDIASPRSSAPRACFSASKPRRCWPCSSTSRSAPTTSPIS